MLGTGHGVQGLRARGTRPRPGEKADGGEKKEVNAPMQLTERATSDPLVGVARGLPWGVGVSGW